MTMSAYNEELLIQVRDQIKDYHIELIAELKRQEIME